MLISAALTSQQILLPRKQFNLLQYSCKKKKQKQKKTPPYTDTQTKSGIVVNSFRAVECGGCATMKPFTSILAAGAPSLIHCQYIAYQSKRLGTDCKPDAMSK